MTDFDSGWNAALEAAAVALDENIVAAQHGESLAEIVLRLKKPLPPPWDCACRGDGREKFDVHTKGSCWDSNRLPWARTILPEDRYRM